MQDAAENQDPGRRHRLYPVLDEPCYVAADSRVAHAMKSNTAVNIVTDAPERLSRYRYFYRNDMYLYRREGLRGRLWLLAKDGWHSAQVIRHGRFSLLRVIWRGFAEDLRFAPTVKYASKLKKGVLHDGNC